MTGKASGYTAKQWKSKMKNKKMFHQARLLLTGTTVRVVQPAAKFTVS